jgi:protein-disulfide isomerase
LAVALVAVAAFAFWSSRQGPEPSVSLGAVSAQEAGDVDTSGILEMSLGDADAPVTMIEYASFTCPHCQRFHEGPFKDLKADYIDTGKVNFIYREVYFDRYGLWAAMLARCGGEEKYFGIVDILYAEQRDWTASGDPATIAGELRKIGLRAGMEPDQVDACLQDGDKARALVALYQENATADGINSTPSFVIDGTKYSNMSYEEMSALLDEAIDG